MCGIAGVLERSGRPVERELLQRMGDVIAHRGPDGEGQHADGPVGLVNRRLAIIDPTPAGAMPMASGDGRYWITYNGEVYNFRELRARARGRRATASARTPTPRSCSTPTPPGGRRASSASTACSRSRSGTRERSELFLARDRFGVKPLYYADLADTFLFGSEIKSMLEHDALTRPPERSRTCSSTSRSRTSSPTGRCSPTCGCCAPAITSRCARTAVRARPQQYWDFDFREADDGRASDEEYEEELDRLFRQAVAPAARERRPGRRAPERRHGLGEHHRAGRRGAAVPEHVHGGVRHDLAHRHGGRRRRAREGRGDVVPVQDRALRGRAQVRRHGALPAGARLAPRGPARRPELPELLRRAAGEQVRQGRAVGLRRRRAVRRLPVALLPRGRQRRLRRLRREVLRVLAPPGPERGAARLLPARRLARDRQTCGRSTSSATSSPTSTRPRAPRSTSTTRSTSRRRRSCTACSSSRTSSAWRTASRAACRSWTTTSSTSRSACRSG